MTSDNRPEPDHNGIPNWRRILYKWSWDWLVNLVGRRWAVILWCGMGFLSGGMVSVLVLYSYWDNVRTWPVVAWVAQDPIPQAAPDRYTVLVAHLNNDSARHNETLVVQALAELEGIKVLRLDRMIDLEGADIKAQEEVGHDQARAYLRYSGAQMLIWGTVLSHDGKTLPKLYLTTSATAAQERMGRYPIKDFALPELFLSDLADLLRVVVTADSASFPQVGHFVADQLKPHIDRIKHLLSDVGDKGWDADTVADIRLSLASALHTYGGQTGEREALEEAIATYKKVLQVFTRERKPVEWGITQNNLGNALSTLGARDTGTVLLKEAVLAYRSALQERARDKMPIKWAMTQRNLGTSLQMLGEREPGTARLQEAASAHRAALEVYTKDRMPLAWAMTQNELASTLRALGEREAGTARLQEAVSVYRVILEVRTREQVPMSWALTQHNLGNVLISLGTREIGTEHLEEAVLALRRALEERTRDRVPLKWAMTQNSLGRVLTVLGGRESAPDTLLKAVAVLDSALTVVTPENDLAVWSAVMSNREAATALLARWEPL